MSLITLEEIKATQSKLAGMIASFEAQRSTIPLIADIPELRDGEKYVGAVISADGTRKHHIILLPGSMEEIKWQQAMEWAAKNGGELPDRVESALLFATMKDEFEPSWYWTREQPTSYPDYAWDHYFGDGIQGSNPKSFEGRARAVRRVWIER
jgi:hypothetical protein